MRTLIVSTALTVAADSELVLRVSTVRFRTSMPAPPLMESEAVNVAAVVAAVAANVSLLPVPTIVSEPVVSELVKPSQKLIVFNELRVVSGCVFSLTHRRPNCKKYALAGFAIGAVFA